MERSFFSQEIKEKGAILHHLQTDKFRTNFLKCIMPVQLNNLASYNALLPFVLFRGTARYPKTLDMVRRLEDLYGTDLAVDVRKRGEWQLVDFSLETVNSAYLPPGQDVFPEAVQMLTQLLFNPLVLDDGFKKTYVNSEKRTLVEEIKSLKNNKMEYAMERCFQEMCRGEPFAIYRYGDCAQLESITEKSLYEHYHNYFARVPVYMFSVGDMEFSRVMEIIGSKFPDRQTDFQYVENINKKPDQEKVVVEEDTISQGKLIMGYRTGITRRSSEFAALLMANGLLGGFPHARLFRQVREERGLAYYIFSSLESTKGLLVVSAGIDDQNFHETVEIVKEQIEEMKQGKISPEELKYTRKSLISQLKIVEDDGFDLASIHLLGVLNFNPKSTNQLIQEINSVEKADIVEACNMLSEDTVYFLQPGTREVI